MLHAAVVLLVLGAAAAETNSVDFGFLAFSTGKTYAVSVATFSAEIEGAAKAYKNVTLKPSASDPFGCVPLGGNARVSPGTIVFVMRGNCTFSEKSANAAAAGAAAVVVVNNDTYAMTMGRDTPKTLDSIVVAGMAMPDYEDIVDRHASGLQARFVTAERGYTAMVALWIMAVGTVVVGSLWASPKVGQRMATPQTPQDPENPTVFINEYAALGFVVMASAVLVLLFYFMKNLILVIIVLFCVGSISAMYKCFYDLTTYLIPFRKGDTCARNFFVPCFGDCDVLSLVITACCTTISAMFLVYRKEDFAWVFQDIMGVSMCLLFIKTFRFPNIKISAMLLSLAFFYDIFWVFISPKIFSGKSVMVHVATGGGSGEAIPMLLKFPNSCFMCGPGLLGLGDIVLPGLLVSYTRAFDRSRALPVLRGYFMYNVIGYGVGLLITYAALLFMNKGQPALLYLVPCTLGTTILLGLARGDMTSLWTGKASSGADDHNLPTRGMLMNEAGSSASSHESP